MAQIILDSNSNLIQGDFDTATLSQRTRLQTSTVNATTGVYVVPNGSATSASVQVSNAADPTNASKVVVATNGSTDTQIVSGANGSGTYLPLSFYTNNDIRFQMGTAGELNVRTAPGTVSSGTSGQFLTSGGPGAGVSWTTAASGQLQSQLFTAPGTWTNPGTVTSVRVTVYGGGGGGGAGPGPTFGGIGGYGGLAVSSFTIPTSPVAITVGSGGNGRPAGTFGTGSAGSSSSFGPYLSATGGTGGGLSGVSGTPGTGTISAPASPGGLKASAGGRGIGYISGYDAVSRSVTTAAAYSINSDYVASAAGDQGTAPTGSGGGIGGAVLVEFIG